MNYVSSPALPIISRSTWIQISWLIRFSVVNFARTQTDPLAVSTLVAAPATAAQRGWKRALGPPRTVQRSMLAIPVRPRNRPRNQQRSVAAGSVSRSHASRSSSASSSSGMGVAQGDLSGIGRAGRLDRRHRRTSGRSRAIAVVTRSSPHMASTGPGVAALRQRARRRVVVKGSWLRPVVVLIHRPAYRLATERRGRRARPIPAPDLSSRPAITCVPVELRNVDASASARRAGDGACEVERAHVPRISPSSARHPQAHS